jgi:hypothetical protein
LLYLIPWIDSDRRCSVCFESSHRVNRSDQILTSRSLKRLLQSLGCFWELIFEVIHVLDQIPISNSGRRTFLFGLILPRITALVIRCNVGYLNLYLFLPIKLCFSYSTTISSLRVTMSYLPQEAFTLHGGCDCRAIRYTISIPAFPSRPILSTPDLSGREIRPPEIFFDHCNKCRRVSGALLQAWLSCPQEWLEWHITRGNENSDLSTLPNIATSDLIKSKPGESTFTHYASSKEVTRSFCGKCGTNLLYVFEGRIKENPTPIVDIVLGSLDSESLERPGVRPDRHFYWDSGVEWVKRLVADGDTSLYGENLPRHPDGGRMEIVEIVLSI